jgi:hypothetical protein
MSDYQAAKSRVEKINASGAGYGNAVLLVYGHEPEGQFYRDLRTLLAGPPEPSVEEVAMAWLDRSMPLPPPDSPLNVAMRALAISAAERVQALYASPALAEPGWREMLNDADCALRDAGVSFNTPVRQRIHKALQVQPLPTSPTVEER